MIAGARPTVAFLLRHPAHVIALGFGSGLVPFAPGTWGTLVAIPLDALLRRIGSDLVHVALLAALVALGALVSQRTMDDLGTPDHGSIVIDEIAAFAIVLFFLQGGDWTRVAVAFVLFRAFDIVKPPPIRAVDRRFGNGWGVMADDLLAAGYTLLVVALAQRATGWPP